MSLFHSEKPTALQGARLLRRGRHRHGALLGSDRGRGHGQDRLSPGAGLGRPDERALGVPGRPRPREAACCSPATRSTAPPRSSGGWPRGGPGGRARRALRGTARADRPSPGQPARHAQAAHQPGALRAGPPGDLRNSASSSTESPGTRPRASASSAAPPRPGSRRRSGSGTSPSETSGDSPLAMNPEITAENDRRWLPGTFPGDMAIEPVEITDEVATGPHGRRQAPSAPRWLRPRWRLDRSREIPSPPGRPSGTCRPTTTSRRSS